jgi:hypothetical protein
MMMMMMMAYELKPYNLKCLGHDKSDVLTKFRSEKKK